MGLKPADLSSDIHESSLLGSWHANLKFINRKKCVVFINDKTLINFIIPDIPRALIRQLDQEFSTMLSCVLADLGYSSEAREMFLAEYDTLKYGNTNNKSVLGSLNDVIFHYEYQILSRGGVHSYHVPEIIREMNHMPMSAIEETFPDRALKKLYENAL